MKILWSAQARSDLVDIVRFVADHNPKAAAKLRERLRHSIATLQSLPHIGRQGRVRGTYELVISGTPYIVPYAIKGETVRLLRVYHEARLWPEDFRT